MFHYLLSDLINLLFIINVQEVLVISKKTTQQ